MEEAQNSTITAITQAAASLTGEEEMMSKVQAVIDQCTDQAVGEDCLKKAANSLTKNLASSIAENIRKLTKSLYSVCPKIDYLMKEKIEHTIKEIVTHTLASVEKSISNEISSPVLSELFRVKMLLDSEDPPSNGTDFDKMRTMVEGSADQTKFWFFYVAQGDEILDAVAIKNDELNQFLSNPNTRILTSELVKSFQDSHDDATAESTSTQSTQPLRIGYGITGTIERFSRQLVNGVPGSTRDKREPNWVAFWERYTGDAKTCYIAQPVRRVKGSIKGGHLRLNHYNGWWYILPICSAHNNTKFDRIVMTTKTNARAVRIRPKRSYSDPSLDGPEYLSSLDTVPPEENELQRLVINSIGNALKSTIDQILKSMFKKIQESVKFSVEDAKEFTTDDITKEEWIDYLYAIVDEDITGTVKDFRWEKAEIEKISKEVISLKEFKDVCGKLRST